MKFYNIEFVNKSWPETILSGFMLDTLVDLRYKNQKVSNIISNSMSWFFRSINKKNRTQVLDEGAFRIVAGSGVLSKDRLSVYYKIHMPKLTGLDKYDREQATFNLVSFIKTVRFNNEYEFFYVNRKATINDYLPYIYSVNRNFKRDFFDQNQRNDRDRQLLALESNIAFMLDSCDTQITECYIIISVPSPTIKVETIYERIAEVNEKCKNVLSSLANCNIQVRALKDEELHKFMSENMAFRYNPIIDTTSIEYS